MGDLHRKLTPWERGPCDVCGCEMEYCRTEPERGSTVCQDCKSAAREDAIRAERDEEIARLKAALAVHREAAEASVAAFSTLSEDHDAWYYDHVMESMNTAAVRALADPDGTAALEYVRGLERERDEARAQLTAADQLICDWQAAAGLERGGDPSTITPEDCERNVQSLMVEAEALRRERDELRRAMERHVCQHIGCSPVETHAGCNARAVLDGIFGGYLPSSRRSEPLQPVQQLPHTCGECVSHGRRGCHADGRVFVERGAEDQACERLVPRPEAKP